ncbi:MAG TPA: ATP-binding cassette domain-containing protein, partial [Candidatus Marinimicrobia bacterium]|nr:ATP-binding cassette domain-containing protein [Candidatus Neomarinimicrobiota bacterium]
MRSRELVNVKDLTVHFPVYGGVLSKRVATVKAVDGVSFSIGKKETIGLVGESGCGKTTVGRAMINILRHVAPD